MTVSWSTGWCRNVTVDINCWPGSSWTLIGHTLNSSDQSENCRSTSNGMSPEFRTGNVYVLDWPMANFITCRSQVKKFTLSKLYNWHWAKRTDSLGRKYLNTLRFNHLQPKILSTLTFRLPPEVFIRRMKSSFLHPVLGTSVTYCAKNRMNKWRLHSSDEEDYRLKSKRQRRYSG